MIESRISKSAAIMLISTAVFIDILEFVLDIMLVGFAVDSVIDVFATFLFGIWFSHYGVSLMKKNPLGYLGTAIAEFIPFINSAPWWTIYVWYTIKKERMSEAEL